MDLYWSGFLLHPMCSAAKQRLPLISLCFLFTPSDGYAISTSNYFTIIFKQTNECCNDLLGVTTVFFVAFLVAKWQKKYQISYNDIKTQSNVNTFYVLRFILHLSTDCFFFVMHIFPSMHWKCVATFVCALATKTFPKNTRLWLHSMVLGTSNGYCKYWPLSIQNP